VLDVVLVITDEIAAQNTVVCIEHHKLTGTLAGCVLVGQTPGLIEGRAPDPVVLTRQCELPISALVPFYAHRLRSHGDSSVCRVARSSSSISTIAVVGIDWLAIGYECLAGGVPRLNRAHLRSTSFVSDEGTETPSR
jgi:hypothetical protein